MEDDPINFRQAIESSNSQKWIDAMNVTPQKYPRIFIIILLFILGMNWAKLGFFLENDDLTNYEIANLVNPEI